MQQDKQHIVHLHGNLSKYCEEGISIYTRDMVDTVQGLVHRFGETFKQELMAGDWIIGKSNSKDLSVETVDKYIIHETLNYPITEQHIHIFPAISGAGTVGRIVLGVVLIVVAIVLTVVTAGATTGLLGLSASTVGTIISVSASLGVGLLAAGISGLLASSPNIGDRTNQEADKNESFIYNGAVNSIEQGGPIPLVFGRHYTGSTVISTSIDTVFKTANLNFINNRNSKFDEDLGDWVATNANTVHSNGSILVEPVNAGYGFVELQVLTEVGKTYTFSCLANRRKNTNIVGMQADSNGTIVEATTTVQRLTAIRGVIEATHTITIVRLFVDGRRGQFDDIYFSEVGFNYKDSPKADIDLASGTNPND